MLKIILPGLLGMRNWEENLKNVFAFFTQNLFKKYMEFVNLKSRQLVQ